MKKKVISVLILTVMLFTLFTSFSWTIPISKASNNDVIYGSGTLTRAEWLHDLAVIFNMEVEDKNYPDNYFKDLPESSKYYYDVLLTVQFGVVDVEAGNSIYPNNKVTRDFAAHTLNYCLGYQLEENAKYTFSDSASCKYPKDAQIAVNRGWVKLSSGKFLPASNLTSTEAKTMLEDAKNVLEKSAVDENYNSTWKVKSGVIEVTKGTKVTINDNIVSIENCKQTIKANDKFVVYQGDLASSFIAKKVSKSGTITKITTAELNAEEAFEKIDAEGILDSDLIQLESGEAEIIEEEEVVEEDKVSTQSLRSNTVYAAPKTVKLKKYNFSKKFDITNNVSSSIKGTYSNIKVEYQVNLLGETMVKVSGNLDANASINVNGKELLSAVGINDICLLGLKVKGVGGIYLSYSTSLKGSLTDHIESYVSFGISYSPQSGVRLLKEFKTKKFTMVAQAEADTGFSFKCGLTEFPVIQGYVYANLGAKAKFTSTTYTDNKAPRNCKDFIAYLYANYGAQVKIKYVIDWGEEKTVFDVNNSPIRVYHHYEDGREVAKCARDSEAFKYYTKWNSAYWGSGWMSGYGSYGYDENGNQVKIFDYTLDASDNATITGYHGHLSSLYIPEEIDGYKVVGIKSAVFKNDKNLVYVSIPKTITKINVDTFTGCVNLKHVDLPDTITEICQYAFRGTAITRLDLPDSITSILTGAFRDCKQLKYLKLPKNLERLEREAFRDCKSLESVEIPKSIRYTSGNSGAVDFDGYIGPFSGCDKLTNISFEKGITTIPAYICASCWNISEIKIPDTVTKIGIYAFANCKNATKITISDSVTEIDIGAFTRCQKVENVDIPDSVSIIRKNAFDSCINLKNVKLSKYLETLGGEAFANCGKLTSIEIPKSLTTVGSVSTFGGPKGPFSECANLNNITFEKGRTKVLGFLFANCKGLKEITIPDTVKEIGPRCFEDCTNLEKVVIPNSVTSIGTRTFYNCTALKDITLPNKLTVLEANIFDSCSKLTSIKLPNTLTTISSEAFQNSGIETITIPESVTNIKSSAFESSALNSIKLNNNLVRIEDEVFKNCDKLETISIPNSVTYLGTNVFQDSDALKNVTLGTGITEIKSKAFEHCDSLEKIILPNKVTKIEDNVFLNCIALKEITIPKSVTTIANKIVSYPGKITIYGTKGSYAETYANDKNIKFVSKEVKATKVTLNKTSLSMKKGDKINLIMTVTPADYTDDIIWKSTDANIATVDNNGLVTAKKAGTSTISVTIGKVSANCKITVTDESQAQYPLQSISLNKTSSSITVGETDTLKVTYNPTNTTDNKQVNWTSSNTGVATVSTSGVITAKKAGTATITAKVGTKTATCKVTVKAKETTPTTPTKPIQEDDTLPFKDIPTDTWYTDAVKYAYKNKYIAGYNSTTFAPFDKLSRGQLVTILWRIEGQPDTSKLQNKFTDVDEGVYYTEPIKWANSVGIVKGYGGTTKFGPGDPIIRQDLCIVLNKYAAYKKKSATGTSSLSNFIDYKTVSGYAENAVKWAVENSIVSGNALPDGTKTIAPMANATRCEVAVMLMRYCNKFN